MVGPTFADGVGVGEGLAGNGWSDVSVGKRLGGWEALPERQEQGKRADLRRIRVSGWLQPLGLAVHDHDALTEQVYRALDRPVSRPLADQDLEDLACLVGEQLRYVVKDAKGSITELRCTADLDSKTGGATAARKVKGTIHWVSAAHAIDAEVRLYDRLFTVENPEADKDKTFLDFINPQSLTVIKQAKAEASLANAAQESRFQFEREGYFCADRFDSTAGNLVFNRTIGLRDSFGK